MARVLGYGVGNTNRSRSFAGKTEKGVVVQEGRSRLLLAAASRAAFMVRFPVSRTPPVVSYLTQ